MIARDATLMFELPENGGFTVPWGQRMVPEEGFMPSVIEHAACIGRASKSDWSFDPEVAIAPRRVERARTILARVPDAIEQAEAAGQPDFATACRRLLADA